MSRPRFSGWIATIAVALSAVLAPSAHAVTVSVNFAGGQTGGGASNVTGTAGVVPASGWNNLASNTGTAVAVTEAGGGPGGTITYTSTNNWAVSTTVPGTDDARLMNGYLDNFNTTNTITVSGLGTAFTSGGYDVIVYQSADSAGSWGYTINGSGATTRFGRQLAGGATYPLAGGSNGYIEATSTDPTGGATASNYVRFRNLTGASFSITGNSGTSGDGRVRPNGIQIVSVPEPASVALLALPALAFLTRHRRRDA